MANKEQKHEAFRAKKRKKDRKSIESAKQRDERELARRMKPTSVDTPAENR